MTRRTSSFATSKIINGSVGHKGIYGHEFLEFEFRSDGRLRYSNDSKYKSDVIIRKEVYVNPCILQEIKRIVQESEIMK